MSEGYVTAKFGKEIPTTYSGNALNRVSYLREDSKFLNEALHSPDALFVPLEKFNPLIENDTRLVWLPFKDVENIIGEPYSRTLEEAANAWDPEKDASGASYAQVLFLGLDESVKTNFQQLGAPRFAVDVTAYPQATSELKSKLQKFSEWIDQQGNASFQSVLFGAELEKSSEYSIIGEARIVLDWINRSQFCGGCGRRNMSAWGGFKLICPLSYAGKTECPTKGRITNLSFPRTDCCVIVAVMSWDGSKVLLARGKRFRVKMYSCLAGFLEPGESIEDCVRREVFEESGVNVGRVLMYASQPWPYPANLMIGCIAEVADKSPESHRLNLELDKELLDAKWVSREDLQLLCQGKGDFDFSVPPKSSIAFTLLDAASKGLPKVQ